MTVNRPFGTAVCFALLMMTTRLSAGIRPSFSLEECAWPSTNIVVAARGDKPGAALTVLETWKGDLANGAIIEVVGLPATPIKVSTLFNRKPSVATVGGSRIVLFLKQVATKDGGTLATQPAVRLFEGTAQFGGAQVFAVWIEKDQAYAFQQIFNPGPTELHPLDQSEAKFKKDTLAILAAKDELRKAKAIENPLDRARTLRPMAAGSYSYERKEAFEALGGCGKPALPMLREMLRYDRYDQSRLVHAIADAAGSDAGMEMTAILQDELTYWKSVSPTLEVGWGNADPTDRRQVLRNHYDLLDTGLRVLSKLPYQPSRDVVVQIRDFWSSLPQLNELNQIVNECDQVLKGIGVPAAPRTQQ